MFNMHYKDNDNIIKHYNKKYNHRSILIQMKPIRKYGRSYKLIKSQSGGRESYNLFLILIN